jgi:hypothetical protein
MGKAYTIISIPNRFSKHEIKHLDKERHRNDVIQTHKSAATCLLKMKDRISMSLNLGTIVSLVEETRK